MIEVKNFTKEYTIEKKLLMTFLSRQEMGKFSAFLDLMGPANLPPSSPL